MVKKILVIGSTGMLGKPVTKALVEAGFQVSALVRDPKSASKNLPSNILFIKGDLKNEKDVSAALEGQDAIYLSLSIKQTETEKEWHSEKEGLEILLRLAKEKNIQRIGYLSSLVMFYQGMNGFKWWVFDIKHKAVEMIKASGIPSTIFYPSNFMESLNNMYKMKKMMLLAGKSKHPMYFIAGDDYGRQVAKAFSQEGNDSKEYVIQGTEAFIADDAVKTFKANYKKERLIVTWAPLGVLKLFGSFNTKMNYGANILEALNNYPEKFEAEKTWKDLGEPEITIKRYASSL